MEHDIMGNNVAVSLGNALRIHRASNAVQLIKQVESVKHHDKSTIAKRTRKAGIPHQIVGIHRPIHIDGCTLSGRCPNSFSTVIAIAR